MNRWLSESHWMRSVTSWPTVAVPMSWKPRFWQPAALHCSTKPCTRRTPKRPESSHRLLYLVEIAGVAGSVCKPCGFQKGEMLTAQTPDPITLRENLLAPPIVLWETSPHVNLRG